MRKPVVEIILVTNRSGKDCLVAYEEHTCHELAYWPYGPNIQQEVISWLKATGRRAADYVAGTFPWLKDYRE